MRAVPLVGIFFQVDGALLVDAVPAADAEPYGRAVQHSGHYDYWAALQPATAAQRRFKARHCDVHPRGRGVHFPDRGRYRVYLDRCLTHADRRAVITVFGLQDQPVEFDTSDPHYVCGTCSDHLEQQELPVLPPAWPFSAQVTPAGLGAGIRSQPAGPRSRRVQRGPAQQCGGPRVRAGARPGPWGDAGRGPAGSGGWPREGL